MSHAHRSQDRRPRSRSFPRYGRSGRRSDRPGNRLPAASWRSHHNAATPSPVDLRAACRPEGQLVKVWLRYDETATKQPAAGFQACRTGDQNARIVESFAIEVGDPANGEHGSLSIAGRSVDAAKARSAFN